MLLHCRIPAWRNLALLIADGLAVDEKGDLRMIAERVEKTVGISGNPTGTERDGLAKTGSGIKRSAKRL
jgi:hypothetical protein